MTFKAGFNFRATLGYVTDPADTQFASSGLGTSLYPHTNAGVTFGWSTNSGLSNRDRSTSNDPRLAGVQFRSNATTSDFRVDLPASGTYDITLALGDVGSAQSGQYCGLYDGTTLIATINSAGVFQNAGQFFDAQNNLLKSPALWVSNNAKLRYTFTNNYFVLRLGGGGFGTNDALAHVAIEQVGVGTTVSGVASSTGTSNISGIGRSIASVTGQSVGISAVTGVGATTGTTSFISGAGISSPRTSYYTNVDTAASANVSQWTGMASSRDCSKIFITNNNSVYFKSSLDGGSTWNETTLSLSGSDAKVYCIASNLYSTKLFIIAATSGDATVHVYMSIDNGITWTLQATNNNLIHASAIVSNADGSLLVASVYGGYIYTSTNFGVTWTQQTGSGSRNWILNCLAISDDGTKIIASPDNGTQNLYLSTDFGVTWTAQTSIGGHYWTDLSMSADGTKMFAVNWDGADHVYVSTNSGSTWATREITTTGNNIVGGYVSRDGSKMVAMDQLTGLSYYSLDNGVTWNVIPTGDNTMVNSQTIFNSNYDGTKVFQVSELGSYVRNFNFVQIGSFGIAQHPFGWDMSKSKTFTISTSNQKQATSL